MKKFKREDGEVVRTETHNYDSEYIDEKKKKLMKKYPNLKHGDMIRNIKAGYRAIETLIVNEKSNGKVLERCYDDTGECIIYKRISKHIENPHLFYKSYFDDGSEHITIEYTSVHKKFIPTDVYILKKAKGEKYISWSTFDEWELDDESSDK